MRKAVILGWDGVPPNVVFDQLLDDMPNLKRLLKTSTYGPLRSTKPAITIPAWMSMMTGCDPGQLGVYGFRHRRPGEYKKIYIPDSSMIKSPKVWDFVGDTGQKVIVIGVPPTYPPPKVNGVLVSGFIAPDKEHDFTYPPSFAKRIDEIADGYDLDVFYRTEDKDELQESLFEMTRKRHKLVMHLLQEEEWNLFVLMEIGPDRLHHGFWKYFDKNHHLYEEGNKYEEMFVDYYRLLDQHLGEMLESLPEDTLFILASDHGAKARKGAFCTNQWLHDQGYLKLKKWPDEPQSFEDLDIDWRKTKAWAWGGYYSRIFINVEGYEEEGIVPPEEFEELRDELAQKLKDIKGPDGEHWDNIVDKPEDVYEECRGDYPDLMVYFDNLCWRASGTMGYDSNYFYEDHTGPDDAIHDWDGIFVARHPAHLESQEQRANILDITPTALRFMGLEVPDYMKGKPIWSD